MIVSRENFLRFLLASPDPVLIVRADGDEAIVASNAAARRLFRIEERALENLPLQALLPNVVARAVAVDADATLDVADFVRAWARVGNDYEDVTLGAIRGAPGDAPQIAIFVRPASMRLREPSEAEISEARLQFALDSAGIGDWDMDLRTNTAFRSRLHDACFGYTTPPTRWGYDTFLEHVHADDRERVDACYTAALAGRTSYDVEFRAIWPDGSVHWLWSKARVYYDAAGVAIRIAGIQVDISERKRIEARVSLNALAMDSTSDGILVADARLADFPTVYVNASFERMTGFTAAEVVGRNCRFLQGPESASEAIDEIREALAAGRAARVTLQNYRKDGSLFWNQVSISPVRDGAGLLTHFVGVQTDVTAEKRVEAELLHRATHDAMTGLPNRRLLEERLAEILSDAERSGTLVAVAFLDLDRLKWINDSLGHDNGDALLCLVAERLREAVRASDVVARFGGDEFVIVMPDLALVEDAEAILATVRTALTQPYTLAGVEISPNASIGIALFPRDACGIVDLIRAADTAMYVAKVDRGSDRFYDRVGMRPPADRIATENALRRALARGEFAVEYQPIYDARTARIASLEALLRWRDPTRGTIAPGDFIALAEESGLIVPIGEWVLREICRQQRSWAHAGIARVPIAYNLSVAQLRRRDFVRTTRAIVADEGIDPRLIALEVTESVVMENAERFVGSLDALRDDGFRISIDDFGTGFSSLNYLKRLSLDTLKIDKSFVDDVASDTSAAAICRAVVTLAHTVGLTTIAEGVETAAQATFLREIGCDELQGFYFARPSGAETIEKLLRATR